MKPRMIAPVPPISTLSDIHSLFLLKIRPVHNKINGRTNMVPGRMFKAREVANNPNRAAHGLLFPRPRHTSPKPRTPTDTPSDSDMVVPA